MGGFFEIVNSRWKSGVIYSIVVIFISLNIWQITSYLIHPRFSFAYMAHGVRTVVEEQNTKSHEIIGQFANSISLDTGLPSINLMGAESLGRRLDRYKPSFFVTLAGKRVPSAISVRYRLKPVGKWKVFHDYYSGPVVLYRLDRSSPAKSLGFFPKALTGH